MSRELALRMLKKQKGCHSNNYQCHSEEEKIETVTCYKTNGKVFDTEKEAVRYEAECNFKKELYELGGLYDYDIVDRIFDDWKYIDDIIAKYKKDIGEED